MNKNKQARRRGITGGAYEDIEETKSCGGKERGRETEEGRERKLGVC